MSLFNGVSNIAGKVVDKIPTEKDRLEQLNKILENIKDLDLHHLQARNNINIKNPRSWLEIAVVLGFIYSILVVPIINDIFKLTLLGLGSEVKELLYAMLGLGGYRLAEKITNKK